MNKLLLAMLIAVGLGYVVEGSSEGTVPVLASGQKPEVGFQAPHFALTGLDNQTYKVEGKRDKPVILNFWASWCGPCRAEAPDLQKIQEKYGQQVDLYGINATANDSPESAMAFVKEYKLTFPIPMDVAGTVADRYKIIAFPTTFLVDRQGVIQKKIIGTVDAAALERDLRILLNP